MYQNADTIVVSIYQNAGTIVVSIYQNADTIYSLYTKTQHGQKQREQVTPRTEDRNKNNAIRYKFVFSYTLTYRVESQNELYT